MSIANFPLFKSSASSSFHSSLLQPKKNAPVTFSRGQDTVHFGSTDVVSDETDIIQRTFFPKAIRPTSIAARTLGLQFNLASGLYDAKSFKVVDAPFALHTASVLNKIMRFASPSKPWEELAGVCHDGLEDVPKRYKKIREVTLRPLIEYLIEINQPRDGITTTTKMADYSRLDADQMLAVVDVLVDLCTQPDPLGIDKCKETFKSLEKNPAEVSAYIQEKVPSGLRDVFDDMSPKQAYIINVLPPTLQWQLQDMNPDQAKAFVNQYPAMYRKKAYITDLIQGKFDRAVDQIVEVTKGRLTQQEAIESCVVVLAADKMEGLQTYTNEVRGGMPVKFDNGKAQFLKSYYYKLADFLWIQTDKANASERILPLMRNFTYAYWDFKNIAEKIFKKDSLIVQPVNINHISSRVKKPDMKIWESIPLQRKLDDTQLLSYPEIPQKD